MTLCGLRSYLNMSEKSKFHQDLNTIRNLTEDFPFLILENPATFIVGIFNILLCVFGIVGNGVVLWFLCFCQKGNTFVFLTNLAIADFGVLFTIFTYFSVFFIVYLNGHSHNAVCVTNLCLAFSYFITFCASALFLAAISTDRCIAVFFPLWYRCHRPESLPTIVSALLWPLAFIVAGLLFYYSVWVGNHLTQMAVFFLFDSFIVLLIFTLLIRVCCYSHIWQKGRLYKVVLFALFIFIITLVPQNFLLISMQDARLAYLINDFLTCVNSSANPFIYFFIGRFGSGSSRGSVKVVLKKVFNEEEDYEGQPSSSKTSVQTT